MLADSGEQSVVTVRFSNAPDGQLLTKKVYAQLMNWAELYGNDSFEAKKMIVAQFVKAVHVKRGQYAAEQTFRI